MVFVKKQANKKPGLNIGVIMNKQGTKGDVGLEIEVEGKKLPVNGDIVSPWTRHQDNSLMGEENAEYVFDRPLKFDEVPAALDTLWGQFKKNKSVLDESNRTSVHVHLNVQNWHLNRLTTFLGIYYCLEEILTAWCGEHRVGNLFCLRAKDAPAIIQHVKAFIRNDGNLKLADNLHYSGLNIHSLYKFGSVEFRTLRGVADSDVIKDWVNILRRIYDFSAEYKDPRVFVDQFSSIGPLQLFDDILGREAATVRMGVTMNDDDIRESMYEGIRLAQDVCYCREWSDYTTMEVSPDPFGRSSKMVVRRLIDGPNEGHYTGGSGLNVLDVEGAINSNPAPVSFNTLQSNITSVWDLDPEEGPDMPEPWFDEED